MYREFLDFYCLRLKDEREEKQVHNQSVSRKTRIVLGIDPGTKQTAYVLIQGQKILEHGRVDNDQFMGLTLFSFATEPDVVAIESIVSQGRKFVGNETFSTCWFSGRVYQQMVHLAKTIMVRRMDVANFHVKNNHKKGDPQVRQALVSYYGGESAIGTKKTPGPLYGITADQWSALAIALYAQWTLPIESGHGKETGNR